MAEPWLIVGLGNPGAKYAGNRHNIGFMIADEIVRRYGLGPWRRRFSSDLSEGTIVRTRVLCQKPVTFMNRSGQAVGEAVRFHKLPPARVLVIYDELDLPLGKVRVKTGGGHGGHNGIRDIAHHLGPDFVRVRVGIGHPGDKARVHGHVLSDFAKSEAPDVIKIIDAVADNLPLILAGDEGSFMNKVTLAVSPPAPRAPRPPDAAKKNRPDGPDKTQED